MVEDVLESPYARWLETMCESVMELKPDVMGVCMLAADGTVLTGYYGDVCPQDKALMAYHLNTDATMDVVMANAADILAAAEEEGEDADS